MQDPAVVEADEITRPIGENLLEGRIAGEARIKFQRPVGAPHVIEGSSERPAQKAANPHFVIATARAQNDSWRAPAVIGVAGAIGEGPVIVVSAAKASASLWRI